MDVSSSELRCWQRCKRKWWLQYHRQIMYPTGENRPSNVGNMVHACLDKFYKNGALGDPMEIIEPMYAEMLKNFPQHEDTLVRDRDLAFIMVEAYKEFVKDTMCDNGLEYVATETQSKVQLGSTPYFLTGRMDAEAVRTLTKMRVGMDHKTVKSLDEFPKIAQLDSQFLTYDLIDFLAHDEERWDCMMINMLRRVDSSHQNAKPPFFGRYEVRHNLEELRNHYRHVLSICYEIDAAQDRLFNGEDHHHVVPPSPDKSCNWSCDYRAVCSMFDDGSDVESFLKAHYQEGKAYGHQRDKVSNPN